MQGQADLEGAALALLAFHLQAAAEQVNEFLRNGQPQSYAVLPLCTLEPRKGIKNVLPLLLAHAAYPAVEPVVGRDAGRQGDAALFRKLQGVGQQVVQDLAEPEGVAAVSMVGVGAFNAAGQLQVFLVGQRA